ncbi:IS5 family transposase [Streptomyces sp. M92]|uniref:IS5 family transposase n=1 Tax=Streptomyces sp. M92 TaxID=2944250 RepID=UPI00234A4A35|nr:IS5 family transposase [Streptomyces sp. M92]WCN04078.1 IS5 family transposase [Streptomyces sp. M92]
MTIASSRGNPLIHSLTHVRGPDQGPLGSWRGPGRPRQFRLYQSVVGPGVPLTDAQWARNEPLLPDRTPKRGGRWRDHREVIDAVAYKFQTGTQWVHLPEKYGNWRGVYQRLRMWAVDGTWERVFTALVAQADADEHLAWAVSVDSTIVRAHQHASGARKKGPLTVSRTTTPSVAPAAD